ncbi:unnamed protein product [Arabidopsis thaliana]|nr:unnamed protein product [Arabidopsis thaliana]
MAERCQRIDEEVVASRDEISSLPDDLLIQILLLVPIKDAVGTMILSKRWRYVWTLLPKLEYSDPGDECESVWKFLEKLLELHKAPFLETLCIQLVDRFVRKLELELHWTAEPTSLPKSLYTCKTLVELTLSDKIIVDVPSSVCLPSLNILRLFYVVFKDENSLERLISSCSVLARSKVGLAISDNRDYRFAKVHKLRLEKPHIDVVCHTDDKFLKAISLVTYLVLPLEDPMALDFRGFTFTRLGKLVICPHGHLWLDIIPLILNNSPKLRFLAITSIFMYLHPGKWISTRKSPIVMVPTKISTFHLEEREVIETVLKSMPRVSTTSTLVFK